MSLTSSAAKTCARSKVFAAPSVFSDRVRLAHGLSISFASQLDTESEEGLWQNVNASLNAVRLAIQHRT